MANLVLLFDAKAAGLQLAVCVAPQLAREARERHGLASGSAAALAQALAGTLLVAATERDAPGSARVDVQLECGGPLRGLLVDAETSGAVRGLVRVNDLDRTGARLGEAAKESSFSDLLQPGALSRFDARPLLATAHDEKAGMLSVLRAQPGEQGVHRAAYPFAGADLDAALTLFLRNERHLGGELALEVLFRPGAPLAAVAGALLVPLGEESEDAARILGKKLRAGALHEAVARVESAVAPGNAHALAQELSTALGLGALQLLSEVRPRFACRCSRERVVRALSTLGAAELRDMAGRDGGAAATCDFCAASYRISAAELLELAGAGAQPV